MILIDKIFYNVLGGNFIIIQYLKFKYAKIIHIKIRNKFIMQSELQKGPFAMAPAGGMGMSNDTSRADAAQGIRRMGPAEGTAGDGDAS